MDELARRADELASDRIGGATSLLNRALAILRDARLSGVSPLVLGPRLCRAQPSMAPMWNAVIEAVAAEEEPDRLDRFAARLAKSPDRLVRFGLECMAGADPAVAAHVVTVSYSSGVAAILDALGRRQPLRVSCSESRPALEGRRLAGRLQTSGIAVVCYADAAIASALATADAVLVGADAVGPEWILNKSGTRMLAAAAAQQGVSVYVVASRDKFVSGAVAARLAIREEASAEVWSDPPEGVQVRNVYFETVPLELITAVVTDSGVVGSPLVPGMCAAAYDEVAQRALARLVSSGPEPP